MGRDVGAALGICVAVAVVAMGFAPYKEPVPPIPAFSFHLLSLQESYRPGLAGEDGAVFPTSEWNPLPLPRQRPQISLLKRYQWEITDQWVTTSDHRGMVMLRTQSGRPYVVHERVADRFRRLVFWLEHRGYKIEQIGCLSRRKIAGTRTWSNHARGSACDINPDDNPVRYGRVVTDLPRAVGKIASRLSLVWGGNWRGKTDSMHFEAKESKQYAVVGGEERRKVVKIKKHRYAKRHWKKYRVATR